MKKLKSLLIVMLTGVLVMSYGSTPTKAATTTFINATTQVPVTEITVPPVSTGAATEFAASQYVFSTDGSDTLIPMQLVKGYLYIQVASAGFGDFAIYNDFLGTSILSETILFNGATPKDGKGYHNGFITLQVPTTGTYYFKAHSTTIGMAYGIAARAYCNTETELLPDAWAASYLTQGTTSEVYYKLQTPKGSNGYITVNANFLGVSDGVVHNGNAYVELCDQDKISLSDSATISSSQGKLVFAAKAGKTYYLKVKSYSGVHQIKYNFKTYTDKGGKSKKKAKTISKNKWVKGLVLSEDSASKKDWYKLKLSKKSTITLKTKSSVCSNSIKIEISSSALIGSSKGNISGLGVSTSDKLSMKLTSGDTSYKLPAGTYYIHVGKNASTSNGTYKFRLNVK